MFQRFAVTFQVTGENETYTTSTVEVGLDARQEIAKQVACRRFGRAAMADHVEILELVEIGQPTQTP
jgi:hypothetical protein